METPVSSDQALRAEIAELRARLEEAEETLRAIHSGEVDALVVESPAGPQVYTLQSADAESNRFRGEILTQISDVVIAIDLEQRITYFNAAAERQYHVRAVDVLGRKIDEIYTMHWPSAEAEAAVLAALSECGKWQGETVHRTFDGYELFVDASVCTLRDPVGTDIGLLAVIRDITTRKQAEIELWELERQNRFLANVLETSDQPLGIGFSDGRVDYVNPAFERLTGFIRDELLAMDWAKELTPPEWREIEQVNLEELQRTQQAVRYEKEYFRKDGARVPIELLVGLLSTDTDQPLRYCAFITDLTERKRAQAALLENELTLRLATEKHLHELQVYQIELDMQNEELRKASIALDISRSHYIDLYDFAPVGYLTLTTGGIIAEINLTGAKLLEMECNRLVHRRFGQFIADEHKDRWHHFFLRVKQQGGKQSIDLLLNHKDSKIHFVHLDCQYVKSENEPSPLLRIALTDITERTLAESALRESEARLALIVEEVNAGYWDWDLVANKIYLSSEWKRQLGFNSTELTNQKPKEDRLHPDDRAMVKEATDNFIAGRLPDYDLQFRLRHKNGSYRWIHTRGALLRDPSGHPTRFLGLNLDITDFKRTQELNGLRDQMEEGFRLYVASQTAAAIAHELNQPLTAISYYADLAQHLIQSGNQNPEKLSRYLESCSQQAQRAGQVIRQLMNVLYKGEVVNESVDINQSVQDARNLVKASGQLNPFKIALNLAPNMPHVMTNPLQIQKVLANLLQNSREAMRESGLKIGTITVTTCLSAIDPAMVQVTVCDCGKGVADVAALKTLFQPFFTTKATGLGMGLAISHALIEAHGGKMWAEQNAGPGISVHFTLPVVK